MKLEIWVYPIFLIDETKKKEKKGLTDQNSRTFNTDQVYFSTEN